MENPPANQGAALPRERAVTDHAPDHIDKMRAIAESRASSMVNPYVDSVEAIDDYAAVQARLGAMEAHDEQRAAETQLHDGYREARFATRGLPLSSSELKDEHAVPGAPEDIISAKAAALRDNDTARLSVLRSLGDPKRSDPLADAIRDTAQTRITDEEGNTQPAVGMGRLAALHFQATEQGDTDSARIIRAEIAERLGVGSARSGIGLAERARRVDNMLARFKSNVQPFTVTAQEVPAAAQKLSETISPTPEPELEDTETTAAGSGSDSSAQYAAEWLEQTRQGYDGADEVTEVTHEPADTSSTAAGESSPTVANDVDSAEVPTTDSQDAESDQGTDSAPADDVLRDKYGVIIPPSDDGLSRRTVRWDEKKGSWTTRKPRDERGNIIGQSRNLRELAAMPVPEGATNVWRNDQDQAPAASEVRPARRQRGRIAGAILRRLGVVGSTVNHNASQSNTVPNPVAEAATVVSFDELLRTSRSETAGRHAGADGIRNVAQLAMGTGHHLGGELDPNNETDDDADTDNTRPSGQLVGRR